MTLPGTGAESALATETATEVEAPRTIEQAIAEYRAADDDIPKPESPAEVQARDEAGRFASTASEASPTEAPAQDDDEDDAPPPPAEGEEGEAAEEEAPAEGEEAEAEPFTLKLPGRREEDEDLEVQIDGLDESTRERLAQLRNGYLRGEEYREKLGAVEARESELAGIAEELAEDPGGFLVEKVHPTMQKEAALALLARLMDSDAYDEIVERVNEWEQDPDKRRAFVEAQAESHPPREVRQNLLEVRNSVAAFVPEGAKPEEAGAFQREAFAVLTAYVSAKKLDQLDPAKVPALIAAVAQEYGFHAPTPKAATPTPDADPAPAPAPAPEKIEAARKHGAKLVTASARRREATAVSPAGPGAVAQSGTPPKGQSIEDRLKWYRSQQ